MTEQITFYQQVIDSQLLLRKTLQNELSTNPSLVHIMPRLLDIIDEQVCLLNELIIGLKNKDR